MGYIFRIMVNFKSKEKTLGYAKNSLSVTVGNQADQRRYGVSRMDMSSARLLVIDDRPKTHETLSKLIFSSQISKIVPDFNAHFQKRLLKCGRI